MCANVIKFPEKPKDVEPIPAEHAATALNVAFEIHEIIVYGILAGDFDGDAGERSAALYNRLRAGCGGAGTHGRTGLRDNLRLRSGRVPGARDSLSGVRLSVMPHFIGRDYSATIGLSASPKHAARSVICTSLLSNRFNASQRTSQSTAVLGHSPSSTLIGEVSSFALQFFTVIEYRECV